jgi:hypothetical protein
MVEIFGEDELERLRQKSLEEFSPKTYELQQIKYSLKQELKRLENEYGFNK